MTNNSSLATAPPVAGSQGRIDGGERIAWIQVTLAAVLMVATLPGRTQGLGLITEPLLRALGGNDHRDILCRMGSRLRRRASRPHPGRGANALRIRLRDRAALLRQMPRAICFLCATAARPRSTGSVLRSRCLENQYSGFHHRTFGVGILAPTANFPCSRDECHRAQSLPFIRRE
jgi:hypothetical protein